MVSFDITFLEFNSSFSFTHFIKPYINWNASSKAQINCFHPHTTQKRKRQRLKNNNWQIHKTKYYAKEGIKWPTDDNVISVSTTSGWFPKWFRRLCHVVWSRTMLPGCTGINKREHITPFIAPQFISPAHMLFPSSALDFDCTEILKIFFIKFNPN